LPLFLYRILIGTQSLLNIKTIHITKGQQYPPNIAISQQT
jgi:hypothetical protein